MAVEELAKRTEEVESERKKKYHLTEIKNDREKIREISEKTMSYAREIYPALPQIPDWGIIPSVMIEFMSQTYNFLAQKSTKEMKEVQFEFGDFYTVSIEFGTTEDADKDATFNPKFVVGKELSYDNDIASNNKLSKEAPEIDLNSELETIIKGAQNILHSKYGFIFEDWRYILYIVVATLRVEKDFLIAHKDDEEWGLRINFAEVYDMQIEKANQEDGEVKFYINMGPGKGFKLPAKDDEGTESNN